MSVATKTKPKDTPEVTKLKKRIRILTDVQDHLVAMSIRALRLLESMESDGGARLPYPDYAETKAALKAIAEA